MNVIFRIVPHGVAAIGFNDEALDLDAPCDLVGLSDRDGTEEELDRKSFDTGHEASRYLCELAKRVQ